jgi:hypothetical protein
MDMRPQAPSVWGLKLLVHEPLTGAHADKPEIHGIESLVAL